MIAEDSPFKMRVVTSGSAVTPELFHSPSPKLPSGHAPYDLHLTDEFAKRISAHPLVFSMTPIHLDSPNESATSRFAPIRRNLDASTRASA